MAWGRIRRCGVRHGVGAVTAVVVIGSVLAAAPTASAQGVDGYRLAASVVYRVDAATPAVTVDATYHMTNTTPDRNLGGGRIEFYFYDGIRLPIDEPVDDLTITVDGRAVDFALTEVEGFPVVDIEFNSNLRYDRTARIDLRYRLLGSPPRTADSFIRVNPAYVSFPVASHADDGLADVRVEVPSEWTLDYVGSDFDDVRTEGDLSVLEAVAIENTDEFGVLFTARLDDRLQSTPVAVGPARFEIRTWPGDAEWLAFAQRSISDGVPVLETLLDTPWPVSDETDVIQASTPYLRGYAGFYDPEADVIEVGENLDLHTMLHELTHAWFNRSTITERWLSEGLADEIGARAVAALGEQLPNPDDFDDTDEPVEAEAFPLNTWGPPLSLDIEAEFYGYRTSFVVLRELWEEVGEEQMTELIAATLAGDRAYPPESGEPTNAAPIGWREFLDLAEQVAGSATIADLYREYVVTDAQADDIDIRDTTLVRYDELVGRGGAWAPPEAVRSAMASWSFDRADDRIGEALSALDVRDELADELEPLQLGPAESIETAYQDTIDIAAVAADLDRHLTAATRLAAARSALTERLAVVELDVPALSQADYDAAPVELADDVEALAATAAAVVEADTELAAALARYELTVPDVPADSFVTSPIDTLAAIEADRDTADEVVAVFARRDDAGSVLERIGAVGSDIDDRLADAADRLAKGDLGGASSAAAAANETLAEWDDRGTARLVAVGLGLAIGLLLVMAVRIRRGRPTAPFGPTSAGADSLDDDVVERPVGLPDLADPDPAGTDR
jgi:hypothetical protein